MTTAAENPSTTTHHLVYVKRRVIQAVPAGDAEGWALDALKQPIAHIFGHAFLAERLKKPGHHVLWFVGAPSDPGSKLPFSLDARMSVKRLVFGIAQCERAYLRQAMERRLAKNPDGCICAAIADPRDATYFGFNNVERLIGPALLGTCADVTLTDQDRARLGQKLQSPRRLTPELAEKLTRCADQLARRPQVFISYRWRDATQIVMRLVPQLEKAAHACWWDRWSMARSVAEGQIPAPPAQLETALACAISDCKVGIIVRSQNYDSSKWTTLERCYMEKAHRSNGMRLIVIPQHGTLPANVGQGRDRVGTDRVISELLAQLGPAAAGVGSY
jgi:hypothetical protein